MKVYSVLVCIQYEYIYLIRKCPSVVAGDAVKILRTCVCNDEDDSCTSTPNGHLRLRSASPLILD